MRKVTLILLFVSTSVLGQLSTNETDDLVYRKIFEIEKTKEQIKESANKWIAINFNDANNVIKHSTDESIIVKGTFDYLFDYGGFNMKETAHFTMDIAFKESRYKLEFYDFSNSSEVLKGMKIPIQLDLNMTFEDYFNRRQQNTEAMKESSAKRKSLRELENKDQLKEDYEDYMESSQQTFDKINDKVTSIETSLFEFIKSNKTKDDW